MLSVALYHEPDGNMLCMFEGQQGGVTHIAFSPDGTKLYSGGRKVCCVAKTDLSFLDNSHYFLLIVFYIYVDLCIVTKISNQIHFMYPNFAYICKFDSYIISHPTCDRKMFKWQETYTVKPV